MSLETPSYSVACEHEHKHCTWFVVLCVIYLLLPWTKAAAAAATAVARLSGVRAETCKTRPKQLLLLSFHAASECFWAFRRERLFEKNTVSAAKPRPSGKRRCQTRHRRSRQSSRRGGGCWHRNDTLHSSLLSPFILKISSPTSDQPLATLRGNVPASECWGAGER